MTTFTVIRCGTLAICLASLVVAAGGCGCGSHDGVSIPAMLSDDEVRASEAAARAAAEAEGAAGTADPAAP
jgi:hypothetical protein